MFIPDLNFSANGSRVKKAPGRVFGSATKNLSIFNPKKLYQTLGNLIRGVYSGYRIRIFSTPDPGRKGSKSYRIPDPYPQHCI
jgi:hypothetical protein